MPSQSVPPTEILIEHLHDADWTTLVLGLSRDTRVVKILLPSLKGSDWRVSAKQDRIKHLLERRSSGTTWIRDTDKTVHRAAAWAGSNLKKSVSYLNQFGT